MPGIWSFLVAWPAREPIYDLPRRDIEILASAKIFTAWKGKHYMTLQEYYRHKIAHSANIYTHLQIWYAGMHRSRPWSFTGQEHQQATKWSLAGLEDPVSTCTAGHLSLQMIANVVSPLETDNILPAHTRRMIHPRSMPKQCLWNLYNLCECSRKLSGKLLLQWTKESRCSILPNVLTCQSSSNALRLRQQAPKRMYWVKKTLLQGWYQSGCRFNRSTP